ncbi:hypothetical protein K2173_023905 [Erythroxylum novogranatense]|uniref:BHLH domain-containing protein n=1 Tax=Erythroxylum novogranatense TaxID=1862640 RepID=A0AAV8TPQ4_9ROSI|nr:hypothetical protein K2173_023905 [Erythroxylum novogranatense]
MEGSESFDEGDHLLEGGAKSFSELLFCNDGGGDIVGLGVDHNTFHHYSSSSVKPPKMLCFGGYNHRNNEGDFLLFGEATRTATPQKSGVTYSDSSSASSGNNNGNNVTISTTFNNRNSSVNVNTVSQQSRKRNASRREPMEGTITTGSIPLVGSYRTSKKIKSENPNSTARVKVRREKLGDRITALQQLVSPFGKTDTATVLHEAMGYIRFLQDQVQVLCSPYLEHLPEGGVNGGESGKELRSRGLCLVPAEYTVHVASSNGADYWSPAAMANINNFSSTSSAK